MWETLYKEICNSVALYYCTPIFYYVLLRDRKVFCLPLEINDFHFFSFSENDFHFLVL